MVIGAAQASPVSHFVLAPRGRHRHTRRRPATRQTMRYIYRTTPRARLHKAIAMPMPTTVSAPRTEGRPASERRTGEWTVCVCVVRMRARFKSSGAGAP
eukprot:4470758-Prymnesium_polylepis.1